MRTDKKKKKKNGTSEDSRVRSRRRAVIIVMAEAVLLLLLAITAYGTRILTSYDFEELSPSVYKETTVPGKDGSTQEPQTITSIVEETNEEGVVIGTSVEELPVSTGMTGYRNILLLGLDERSQGMEDNGVQTDVMMILSINNETGDIKMVSVLRDTIMKMEDGCNTAYNKANYQFSYSGISDTVSMVNRNLGLDIGEYVLVNWYGVARVVDTLGGVEMTIPNEQILWYFNGYLTDVNDKTGMWSPQLPAPGTYLMRGTQLVAYCRIRYGGYNDTGRAQNQREAVTKMLAKGKDVLAAGEINQVLQAAELGLSSVRTNLTMPEVLYMAAELGDYNIVGSSQFPQEYTTSKFVGNYLGKYNIADPLVANDFAQEVRNLHQFLFDDPSYEPSDFVKNVSYQMYLDRTGQ